MPKPTLTGYSDPLLDTELITISGWFQTLLKSFPLVSIPPPSYPIAPPHSKEYIYNTIIPDEITLTPSYPITPYLTSLQMTIMGLGMYIES